MEREENSNKIEEPDRFTQFMFGSNVNRRRREENPQQQEASNLNYDELMTNIDTLMDSARNLKPLLNKLSPLITQFLNRK